MVLEKTLESPLDCKEIQPAHSEGDQPCYFFGRNDAKAETPLLWPPHAKSWLTGKDSDAGRDWGQEEKGMTEDEMASWTRWTWVLVNSGSWWWTGRPGVLRFMGLQRVGHDWATELNSTGAEWSRDLFHLLRGEWWSLSFARIHRIGRWVDFPLTLPELDVNASSTTHWLSILNSFLSFSKFQFSHL